MREWANRMIERSDLVFVCECECESVFSFLSTSIDKLPTKHADTSNGARSLHSEFKGNKSTEKWVITKLPANMNSNETNKKWQREDEKKTLLWCLFYAFWIDVHFMALFHRFFYRVILFVLYGCEPLFFNQLNDEFRFPTKDICLSFTVNLGEVTFYSVQKFKTHSIKASVKRVRIMGHIVLDKRLNKSLRKTIMNCFG